MTRVLLVRHGETAWNIEKVFRGQSDIPLTEHGLAQAGLLGEAYKEWPLKAVYSSPLKRALQTAEALAEPHGLSVTIYPKLTSIRFGAWQGVTYAEVQKEVPELYEQWHTQPHMALIPGAEPLGAVQTRAMGAVADLVKRHPDETIALVTHRIICKLVLLGILGLDSSHFWQLRLDTTGVSMFDTTEPATPWRYVLFKVNDTNHLEMSGHMPEIETEDF
jgi:broad specificity phosphatase PhoE